MVVVCSGHFNGSGGGGGRSGKSVAAQVKMVKLNCVGGMVRSFVYHGRNGGILQ